MVPSEGLSEESRNRLLTEVCTELRKLTKDDEGP
jgi:hypothetical protein